VDRLHAGRKGVDGLGFAKCNPGIEFRALRLRLARAERAVVRSETLLQESDHRIKNSLQIVASLLRIQALREKSAAATKALEAAATRIQSIAEIHDALQESGGRDVLDLGHALATMSQSLHVMAGDPKSVALVFNVEPILAQVALAQPLLLAVNELVVNALRHAFPAERCGSIQISAHVLNGRLRVEVVDDGVGLPAGYGTTAGFGSKLVRMMVEKVGGVLTIDNTCGARFTIIAPPPVLADMAPEIGLARSLVEN
jgi:two-component sensor histidine kinase